MSGMKLLGVTPYHHGGGHTYLARLPAAFGWGDSSEQPQRSDLILLEDGVSLGPAHSAHADIEAVGGGRYSHWGDTLYFSTPDGSNPLENRRQYQALATPGARSMTLADRAIARLGALGADPSPAQSFSAVEDALLLLRPDALAGEDLKDWWTDATFLIDYGRLCGTNRRSAERKYVVRELVRSLGHVAGDMAECGVYNGSTAYFMAEGAAEGSVERRLHLFDSFEGLSEPAVIDGDFWRKGSLSIGENAARENLRHVPLATFYKGWIPDRFGEVGDARFAFVHIDVDIYRPTRDSIEFFYPRLAGGGILLCDDYGFATCPGAKAAMDEYFADKLETIIRLPTGQAYAIKRA